MGEDTPAEPPKPSYEVGYCKPPPQTQFKPGRSGNPKGRPKGAKNKMPALWELRLKSMIQKEAYRTIKVREANGEITLTMAEAVLRSVAVNAAKGNLRAQQLFLHTLGVVEDENYATYSSYVQTMIDYKYNWEEEIERCKRQGLPIPNPVPHPDHIEIDSRTGLVHIRGPLNKEDKVQWDKLRKRKMAAREAISEMRKEMRKIKGPKLKSIYEQDIEYEQRILDMINNVIKD